MDRALLVLMALLLNAALAGPRQWYAQLGLTRFSRLPGNYLHELERKLNREQRSPGERRMRGALLVAAASIASIIAGVFCGWLFTYWWPGELLIVTIALPVRPAWDIASQVSKALRAGNSDAARRALEGTAWKHHALLDEYGLARAAIELLSVQFSEKILAPALFYLLFGLPGLFISKSITLMQELFASPKAMSEFGKAAKLADFLLHYVTSRLAAVLWLAASLFMPAEKMQAVAGQIAGGMNNASPQGLALLSAASALKLSLGGPTSIYTDERWIGAGTPKPTPAHIRRALTLYALLNIFLFVLVGFFI